MIELTQQQLQAAHEHLLYDDSEFSIEEAFPLLNEVLGKEGWDDPAMDIYNDITR